MKYNTSLKYKLLKTTTKTRTKYCKNTSLKYIMPVYFSQNFNLRCILNKHTFR